MEERVRLNILGISYNPMQTGAFVMLLAEEGGPYRLPVVIGAAEAQSIAIKLENIITPRPMTHDLLCSITQAFGIELVEVYIYKFEDGIFSSELKLSNGEREVTMDSRASDAVALAIRTGAPIYTTREILQQAGAVFDENMYEQDRESHESSSEKKIEDMTKEEMQELLNKYIEEENYEEASRISSMLKKLEEDSDSSLNP